MKIKFYSTILFLLTLIPATSFAQSSLYIVAEAGTIKNSMAVSGILGSLTPENNSGGTFGGAIGYRSLVSDSFVVGIEGSIASSSASSSVSDGIDTISFEADYVAGAYLTAGVAFGTDNQGLLYGLLGIGSVGGETSAGGLTIDSTSIDDSGSGLSFGGAFEYGLTESIGIRVKALHTRYKGDIDELKIRDTSVMAGAVFSF